MDKIEDSAVQNPHKSVPDSPLQASSSNFAAYPPLGGSDHVAEDGNQHPDQWLTQLQNLDLEEQATGIESRNGASDGEDGGRKASGKSEWESDGDNRIEKLVKNDVIDGKNATEGFAFPLRPEAVDCAFYMKTGNCKYGASCKFNHPVRTKNQDANEESEEMGQKPRHIECKHYLRTGGCKYGKDCRYFHSKAKPHVFPISELNFLGLPIRPGEKKCPFYMKNGSCKFGAYCKFNHPNPKAVGEADPDPVYVNGALGGPITSSQANVASWSVPRPFNETAPYVPVISSTQGFPSQSSEWNGYQTPEYPQERSMHPFAAFVTDNIATETSIYGENQTLISDDEFPERPGEPVCNYFLKTGDCKFKSNCKYHHPKYQAPKPPPCALSDKGLPLRPDQNICSYYSRYGICKFGPACKFDHPINLSSSSLSDSAKPVASTNYPLGSKSRVGSYMG